MCDNKFPSLVASLFSWRCLATSTSSFLHAALKLRPPYVTASTHTSAFNTVAFQSPRYGKRPDVALYAIGPLFLLPTASSPHYTTSKFSNTIRFGGRPPLILRSVPAHKIRLACNVVSMLSYRVISRVRLYEVIRCSNLLRCTPIIRSKTRSCTVRSFGERSTYCIHTRGPRLPRS